MAFDRFCLTVSLAMPAAHALSGVMGVGGCSCPNSSKVLRMWMASRALKNRAPNSASAAEARTFFIMLERTNTAPLKGGVLGVGVPVRKKYPPARERAPGSDK